MQSLVFFNKEGDNLNFSYNEDKERWEGDLLFHENSDDTFKTIGLYTFEKIKSFDYENVGNMKLRKFQLFNESRFTFDGNSNFTQSITKIEATNNDSTFYSKWIYGENFESKFPKGSKIRFDSPIFEFTKTLFIYTVVSTKKNAIMILSNTDNSTFNTTYNSVTSITSSYIGKSISGVNCIGFYNYIENLKELYSEWSEPDFYTKVYDNRKLNIVNTKSNDGIVTIKNKDLLDNVYYKYSFPKTTFTQSSDFTLRLTLKTESPNVYTGGVQATGYKLYFNDLIPQVLKPGSVFTIQSSVLNYNFITVDNIPEFTGNSNLKFYQQEDQVLWNNLIYECIQSHTWSATSSITPNNPGYWSRPTYLPTTTELINEQVITEIHISNNIFVYTQSFTQSSSVTLASFVEKYKNEFNFFDLNLYYERSNLNVDLIYPSNYCLVDFYLSTTGTQSYTNRKSINEFTIETKEILTTELNLDTNENFRYDIIFTDLDDFGFKIFINKQEYNQEIQWVYESSQISYERSIDKTIREWYNRWYVELFLKGIRVKILNKGGFSSIYYNTISIYTTYPNVPINFEVVVGITGQYFIDHSEVTFRNISNYLSININDKSYGLSVGTSNPTILDIQSTLSRWIDEYQEELIDYGIYTTAISNSLIFRTKSQNQRLEYSIQVGKSSYPEEDLYLIEKKYSGNFGALIASNEVFFRDLFDYPELDPSFTGTPTSQDLLAVTISSTFSFQEENFSTGQVVSINNTIYPWNNQEYNILSVEPTSMILGYQGPFWSIIDPDCILSPFFIISYNKGWGATRCITVTPSSYLGSEFVINEYNSSFLVDLGGSNSYTGAEYKISEDKNLQDIIYEPSTENFYILGNRLLTVDARDTEITNTLILPGLTGPIQLGINPVNNFIYCLSTWGIHIVDPRLNVVQGNFPFTLSERPLKFEINSINGDFHLIYQNSQLTNIWKSTNFTATPDFNLMFNQSVIDVKFNPSENYMYYAISGGTIETVNGKNRIKDKTYNLNNPVRSLFYEPSESAIYIFDSGGLVKFNNGVQTTILPIPGQNENYFVYNNVLDQIVTSQTNQFLSITTNGNIISNTLTVTPGQLEVNQYDGDVYQISGQELKVLDTMKGKYKWSEKYSGPIKKIVFNPVRNSIFGIIPSVPGVFEQSSFVELRVSLGSSTAVPTAPPIPLDDNLYGSFDPNVNKRTDIWLRVKEFLRRPKSNFNGDVQVELIWKWENDQTPEFFFFDFSGTQLITSGSYSYTGPKPLPRVVLNESPNVDISKTKVPEFQQTIFDEIVEKLEYLDDDVDVNSEPEPLELFIGMNSKDEGVKNSILKLYRRENISFTITSSPTNFDIIQFTNRSDGLLAINLSNFSEKNFFTDGQNNSIGLKAGQILQIFVSDVTNTRNKYVSFNNGLKLKIKFVFNKSIICEKIEQQFKEEFTVIENYPKIGITTYLSVLFKISDKEIGSFKVYGQTQIEDIRYKIELTNTGQLISPDNIYIFKSYDIEEQGIDWTFLNKKRKELLMVRDQIYSYIGSYKAIINAINYFGYNDLEFYEYYRNINQESNDYGKLFKVEIPDIFDNSVPGWTPNDFIKHTLPNPNFEDTNLFNLTFKITDKEGTNVLMYSLYEVLLKLQGLKMWLQKNVIPLTHRILDITGRSDFSGITTIEHRNYDTRIIKINQDFSPYDFRLNEAYLMPINSGSTVYNCVIDFSVEKQELTSPCFHLKIRTYQTQKEWQPLKIYNKGDKVQYFQQIYESSIDNNRSKNPRKYDSARDWSPKINYNLGDYANYYKDIYQYIGTQSTYELYGNLAPTPKTDIVTNGAFARWTIMTEWKKIEYLPVQTLEEFRTATHSYSFTVDSNLDPFILIEVTSDNGYGQNYTNKKSYEIRGTKDLLEDPGRPDLMGAFTPITQVITSPNLPKLILELTIVPVLPRNGIKEISVTSNVPIVSWEIIEFTQSVGTNVSVSIVSNSGKLVEENSGSSALISVSVDRASQSGNYSFKVKGYNTNGNFGVSSTLSGSVKAISGGD